MFNLTINAVPASTIIVGRRATWLDRHAAEELRDYVKKISGTTLNIADETLAMAVTGNRILIGRPSTSDLVKDFASQNPGILPAESDTENDCLAIVQRGEVLVLSGSNNRSVYYSVCHLLQTVFHVGFYWDRDVYEANPDMTVPDNLTIVERSAFKFRHTIGQWVYNHGAFLNEAERREELDKYARNKINSYRLYSWNSYARKMTFIKLGVPGIEIKPEDIARRDIIRDTIEYAQALGIDIMVTLPPDEMTQDFHKLYPNARYFGSEWVKDDNAAPQTKPCLSPEDPMFKTFFQTFVKVWIEEYGPVHNFVASPPCESHISTTIDDYINISVNYSKYTYEAVHELVPEARVFFDGWGVRANTPPCIWTMPGVMQRFVDSMPDEVYMLDLWPNRKETDATFRDPMYRDANYSPLRKARYVLEALNEFGGDDHMHGDFARHIEAAKEMTDPSIVEHGDGFGNCTELCGVSLHFFDLIFQLAWNPKDITVQSFLEDSAKRRYGGLAPEIGVKAMKTLEQAAYCDDRDSSHARYQKRCYLVRPQRRQVPLSETQQVVDLLNDYMTTMTALPDDKKTDAIGQDMYDVMRQYITENFNMHLRCLLELFLRRKTAKNLHKTFELHATMMEQLLTQLEVMTSANTKMYVEHIVRWLQGRPCDPNVASEDTYIPKEEFRAWILCGLADVVALLLQCGANCRRVKVHKLRRVRVENLIVPRTGRRSRGVGIVLPCQSVAEVRLNRHRRRCSRHLGFCGNAAITAAETCTVQALHNAAKGCAEVIGRGQHIRHIQCFDRMLAGMRLAQDAPDNLFHVDFAGTVGKRCQNIGKGAVPAFFQRIDRNDVPNRAVFAHQVYALQLVYISGLNCNLVVRYADVCQFFAQSLKGSVVLFASGLCLKQNDRADIPSVWRLSIAFCSRLLRRSIASRITSFWRWRLYTTTGNFTIFSRFNCTEST